jgi:hypothetical protein
MLDLSLEQTHALLEIVESGDIDKLAEFVAVHGYDEGTDFDYQTITVSYPHRFIKRG